MSNENNLTKLAQSHVTTIQKTLRNKPVTLNFYITSFHSFSSAKDDAGYDWFFVTQDCFLNGSNGYNKFWAGTNVTVEEENWYVGQGEVCLNYVDSCRMESYIDSANEYGVNIMDVSPVALNNVTTCTSGIEFSIGGQIGFEAGKEGKATGSFSTGVSLSESYTFNIFDCTIKNDSGRKDNNSLVAWDYSFRRARKNTSAGNWQRLIDPADLSHSTFTPTNLWIWKIPTKYRDQVTSFVTKMRVNTINTISRYSGSQDCMHVGGKGEEFSNQIPLTYPPLLIANKEEINLDKQAGSTELQISSEEELTILKGNNADWFDFEYSFENNITKVWITVKELPENIKSRSSKIIIIQRMELGGKKHLDELTIPITQVQNLIHK